MITLFSEDLELILDGYKVVDSEEIFTMESEIIVPRAVASCPVCNNILRLSAISEFVKCPDTELYIAQHVSVECVDSQSGNDTHMASYEMPYVHWLPVENDVEEWLEGNYRFSS